LCLGAFASLGSGSAGEVWRGRRAERATLLILLAVSMLGVTASGQFLYHYYLQLLPPLALLAAPLLASVWRGAKHRWLPSRRILPGWLALSAFGFLVVDTVGLSHQRPTEVGSWIKAHSDSTDRIFVWGQADRKTGIYLEADRRPASRFIASFPLTG